MTTRLTPLALSITTVGAWGLVLAVFAGRPELIVVVLPLLIALLVSSRRAVTPDWSIAHTISSPRVFEGERVMVTVTVTAGEPVTLLELFDPLPPGLLVVSGRNRGFFTLARGQRVEWKYEVECVRRGRVGVGSVHARRRLTGLGVLPTPNSTTRQ